MTAPPNFQVIRLIHIALVMGLVIFMGVVLLISDGDWVVLGEGHRILLWVAGGFAAGSIGMSFILGGVLARNVEKAENHPQALGAYQVMCIVRWALIEGPGMLCLVFMMITRDVIFFALAILCIVFLVVRRPTQSEFSFLSRHAAQDAE